MSALITVLVTFFAGMGAGLGTGFAGMCGSEANDSFYYDENGEVRTRSNHNGGINGGITNGMPILFNCAIKPTPSIYKTQNTVDFVNGKNTELQINGRHDPAIVRRVCHVINAVSTLCVCDTLAQRYGTDVFIKGINQ